MREILAITKCLHESMKGQLKMFMEGVAYADKQKLKELKCVEEIYEILTLLDIDLQNDCINYSGCEAYVGHTLTEMKKSIDIFSNDLSKALKKGEVPKELQVQLILILIELETQWK